MREGVEKFAKSYTETRDLFNSWQSQWAELKNCMEIRTRCARVKENRSLEKKSIAVEFNEWTDKITDFILHFTSAPLL